MKKKVIGTTHHVFMVLPICLATITILGQVTTNMREKILSNNFSTAQSALDENIRQKNVEAICLSLKHQTLIIRRKAADALRLIQNKSSVKCLIEAMEDNQVTYLGGTETAIEQDQLNESISAALKSITALDLPVKANLTKSEVQNIIVKSKQWLAAEERKKR